MNEPAAVAPWPEFWRPARMRIDPSLQLATFAAGRREPDAPTVVLVHGLGLWTQGSWDRLARCLAATHRILAFDLPGFGDSSKPASAYSLAFYSDVLAAFFEHAELAHAAPPALVGHSFGGLIAAAFAARAPARVRMLGLLAPAGFLRTPSLALRIVAARILGTAAARIRPAGFVVRRTLADSVYDRRSLDPEMWAQTVRSTRDPALVRAFLRVYGAAAQELFALGRLHERLAEWQGPTALLWGREDRYLPVRALTHAQRVYPRASALVLERCGHCPHIEYPHEVAAALRSAGM